MTYLRYEDEFRDGDVGYIWPCGCSQHLGGDINYCLDHKPKSISHFACGLQLEDEDE